MRGISSARDSSVLSEGEQARAKGSRGEQMEGVRNERRHEMSARVLDNLIKGVNRMFNEFLRCHVSSVKSIV